ncbi:ATP-binding protein, partial [Pantoea endophytica]
HQYRTLREDGRYYWLEANGHVTHGPGGEPLNFPGVLINIEERRAVEAERDSAASALRALTDTLELRVAERTEALIRSEEKLRQSQKMEAVGQLTGGLAHDFNNLLAGILGSLDMIAARVSQGRFTELSKYMGAAQSAAKRAAALTHRLLAFSRRQTLDPKTIDVNELIDGMCELIQRTVGPSVQISEKPASDLWLVKVDPSQLENSLLNLCINARDAMPRGGDVVIETANISIPESAGTGDQELQPGQYMILSVTDNGVGMAGDVAAKAFEPFFTTKPIGQGTGLGLSMIYGFANQSNGEVRIKSTEGQGTTVSIYLPRFDGALEVTRDIEPSDPPIAPVDGGVV